MVNGYVKRQETLMYCNDLLMCPNYSKYSTKSNSAIYQVHLWMISGPDQLHLVFHLPLTASVDFASLQQHPWMKHFYLDLSTFTLIKKKKKDHYLQTCIINHPKKLLQVRDYLLPTNLYLTCDHISKVQKKQLVICYMKIG